MSKQNPMTTVLVVALLLSAAGCGRRAAAAPAPPVAKSAVLPLPAQAGEQDDGGEILGLAEPLYAGEHPAPRR